MLFRSVPDYCRATKYDCIPKLASRFSRARNLRQTTYAAMKSDSHLIRFRVIALVLPNEMITLKISVSPSRSIPWRIFVPFRQVCPRVGENLGESKNLHSQTPQEPLSQPRSPLSRHRCTPGSRCRARLPGEPNECRAPVQRECQVLYYRR